MKQVTAGKAALRAKTSLIIWFGHLRVTVKLLLSVRILGAGEIPAERANL